MVSSQERNKMIGIMQQHVGRNKGIGVVQLSARMKCSERRCRHIISALREDGVAICGSPATGYYVADNAADLEYCCQFLRSRAMHSLRLESKLRRIALPDLINQLRFTEV